MSIKNVFMTTTSSSSLLDGSSGGGGVLVSDFLTVQSLTNFASMTGAITAAWNALQKVHPPASSLWYPFGFAITFGVISIFLSVPGLKSDGARWSKLANIFAAVFIGAINSLILFAAIVGANVVTSSTP